MKILMVSEDVPQPNLGGLARHAIVLANALARAGHEVVFMGNAHDVPEPAPGDTRLAVPFVAGIPNRPNGWKEQQLGFYNYGKRWYLARVLAAGIRRHAASFDVVHYHGHYPIVGNFIFPTINFVQTRHDQGGDCLTHIRFKHGEVCAATDPQACAGCLRPTPNALQTALSGLSVQTFRGAVRQAFALHKTIHVSEMIRNNLRRTVAETVNPREWVIHNFVDLQALAAGLPGDEAEPESGAITVGRLDHTKGIVELAAKWRTAGMHQLPLQVVGDGPRRAEVEQCADGSVVRYLGLQPYKAVIGVLCRSRLVIVPSLWEEPCATTVLEALALGKVVLALDRGGTPELRKHVLYEGQLRLFPSLDDIVTAAAALAAHRSPITPRVAVERFGWGVEHAMPAILDVYRA
jgi:glycogen(starch) synthase